MRLKFLESCDAGGERYAAGQVVDLEPAAALRWLRSNVAELLEVGDTAIAVPVDRHQVAPGSRKPPRVTRPKPRARHGRS